LILDNERLVELTLNDRHVVFSLRDAQSRWRSSSSQPLAMTFAWETVDKQSAAAQDPRNCCGNRNGSPVCAGATTNLV